MASAHKPKRLLILGLLLAVLAAVLVWRWPALKLLLVRGAVEIQARKPEVDEPRLPVNLRPIASGFEVITDLQVPPDAPETILVVEKAGKLWRLDTATGDRQLLATMDVSHRSETGLLGLALHPRFAVNRLMFIYCVAEVDGRDQSLVEAWTLPPAGPAQRLRRVLQVDQPPYPNHKAGQLAFGADGYLYVGLGDGGSAGDPHGNGQNLSTLLGKILRIDVDRRSGDLAYAIPADNPFVATPGARPEIWALGLRNPWRFSFDSRGRLVIADVGQDSWEELDLGVAGGNYGWNRREGRACYPPGAACDSAGLVEPFWQGRHPRHLSVTGGYLYEGKDIPRLAGRYVFGDFVVRRLWAIDLPTGPTDTALRSPVALCDHEALVTTFGRRRDGELYVGDFGGRIWRLVP